jgi:hypothetical protein
MTAGTFVSSQEIIFYPVSYKQLKSAVKAKRHFNGDMTLPVQWVLIYPMEAPAYQPVLVRI